MPSPAIFISGLLDMPFLMSKPPTYPSTPVLTMTEKAERINGLAAMLGIVAAIGAYAVTGQIIPGIW